MSIIEHFQKLDDLIIEHTKPPVTSVLRHQLTLTQEQIEAYQASSNKQAETLTTQIKTIERLMIENETLISQKKRTHEQAWKNLARRQYEHWHSHDLKENV